MSAKKRLSNVWVHYVLSALIFCACNLPRANGDETVNYPSQEGFISIDCGGTHNLTTSNGLNWTPDSPSNVVTGAIGYASIRSGVPEQSVENTVRYFPTGAKNCYVLGPVIPGKKYLVRVKAQYFNYDGLMRDCMFNVSIGPTLIDVIFSNVWPYSEYILEATDTSFDVCFIRVPGGGDPFVTTLEVRPMGDAYREEALGNVVMSNWRRLACGLDPNNGQLTINSIVYPDDPLDRLWGTDQERMQPMDGPDWGPLLTWPVDVVTKNENFTLGSIPPVIYSSATTTLNDTDLTFILQFDNQTGYSYMLYLYFAELDDSVGVGDRVFDILINGEVVYPGLDIRRQGGSLGAINIPLFLNFTFLCKNQTTQRWANNAAFLITLSPTPQSRKKKAIISGIESYILVPRAMPSTPSDVEAMRAVRAQLIASNNESLIGSWEGDPCLPVPWDNVLCGQDANKAAVVTGLTLGNLSLTGPIPAAITKLSSLETLYLNDNDFSGPIPASLPTSLKTIRVENNQLNGTLPSSLASLAQLHFLNVSNNPLSGSVDASLFDLAKRLTTNFSLTYTHLCPSAIDQCSNNFQMRPLPPPLPPTSGTGVTSSSPSAPPLHTERTGTKSSGSRNLVAIVGGVVAGVVLLAALAAVVILCSLRSKRQPFFSSVGGDSSGQTSSTVMDRVKRLHEGLLGSPGARFGQGGRIFTLKDMETATNRWSHSNIIGVGGFGIVYRASFDGKELAVKKRSGSSMQGEKEFYNEVDLLSRVRHKHLVTLAGYCNEGQNQILVYEFMSNGTVRDHLYDDKGEPLGLLDWRMRLSIALGAARGIEYLHTGSDPSIIHRDIKTSNILLDDNFTAKVADFGLSKLGPEGFNTHVSTAVKGTAGYLDPEYYTVQQLTTKSDVFSFGVVLLELITGREPINHNRPRSQWNIIEWARPELQGGNLKGIVDPSLGENWSLGPMWKMAEIGILCVEPHAENRPTMSEVVRELKEAVDMEFGMQNYIAAEDFDGEMEPGFSTTLEPVSNILLNVEAR